MHVCLRFQVGALSLFVCLGHTPYNYKYKYIYRQGNQHTRYIRHTSNSLRVKKEKKNPRKRSEEVFSVWSG